MCGLFKSIALEFDLALGMQPLGELALHAAEPERLAQAGVGGLGPARYVHGHGPTANAQIISCPPPPGRHCHRRRQ